MKPRTISDLLAIKAEVYSADDKYKALYERVLKDIEENTSLAEGLTKAGFSTYQVMLVSDLLINEHTKTEEDIYKLLTIFTTNKEIH